MHYSKKKSFALLDTLILIALRFLRNPLLTEYASFTLALRGYTVI